MGPGLALEGRDMGDAKLAYGMKGVGKEIHGRAYRRRPSGWGQASRPVGNRWQLRVSSIVGTPRRCHRAVRGERDMACS